MCLKQKTDNGFWREGHFIFSVLTRKLVWIFWFFCIHTLLYNGQQYANWQKIALDFNVHRLYLIDFFIVFPYICGWILESSLMLIEEKVFFQYFCRHWADWCFSLKKNNTCKTLNQLKQCKFLELTTVLSEFI